MSKLALTDFLNNAAFLDIRVGGNGDSPRLIALLRAKVASLRLLLPSAYRGQNPLVDKLGHLGAQIRYVNYDIDGFAALTNGVNGEISGLIDSLRLTAASLDQLLEVGETARFWETLVSESSFDALIVPGD